MKKLALLMTLTAGLGLPVLGYAEQVTDEQASTKEISNLCQECERGDETCKVDGGVGGNGAGGPETAVGN